MASCAVCLQPITRGQGFLIRGTESVHRRTTCLTGETLLERTRRVASDHDLRAASQLQLAVEAGATARRDLDMLRTQAGRTERAHDRTKDLFALNRDAMQSEIYGLRAELDQLRIELARRPIAAPAVVAEPVVETRDDAEVRFSQLELD